jgi:lipopolysaccharide transport system ATP-binding protein
MSRREITAAFDSIVEFAGVTRFLDTPVKRYSTGMYVRLAFAVAAHLSSEILLVDEVLAVGDAAFQKKCLGIMREAATSGRTVVFVSHQMSAIAALCDRAIVLDRGESRFSGEAEAAIEWYLGSVVASPREADVSDVRRAGGGEWRAADLRPAKESFRVDEVKTFEFSAHRLTTEDTGFYPSANIVDEKGTVVARCDGRLMDAMVSPTGASKASFRFTLRTPWLRPGRYYVDVLLENFGLYDHWERACTFEVLPVLPYKHTAEDSALGDGAVLADFDFVSLDQGE